MRRALVCFIALAAGTASTANTVAADRRPGLPSLAPSGRFSAHVNGQRLPVMGWNPWNAFRTHVTEAKIMGAANFLVSSGLAGKGYRYVNIDDGWWLKRREDGRLEVRTNIFPSAALGVGQSSFRPIADRLHGMGLKLGLYGDIGRNTCAQKWDPDSPNLPEGTIAEREVGSFGFQEQDIATLFNDWNIDLIKLDACGLGDYGADQSHVRSGAYRLFTPLIVREKDAATDRVAVEAQYARYGDVLKAARPDGDYVFSICAWGEARVRQWAKNHGTMWRTSEDIRPTWTSMLRNFDSGAGWTLFAGPGHWNDLDMLVVGLGEFDAANLTKAKAHLSIWAILSAPLIMGHDIANSAPEITALLGNAEVIAIDQDPAGNPGAIVSKQDDIEIVSKTLAGTGERAVAFINRGSKPQRASVTLDKLGLANARTSIRDVWEHRDTVASGPAINVNLKPYETRLVRLKGAPLFATGNFLGEVPARINVAVDGTEALPVAIPVGWIPARVDAAPSGKPLSLAGKAVTHGIGILANSRIEFRADGDYRRLRTLPAVLPGAPPGTIVEFRVYGDGKLIASRRTGAGRDRSTPIDVDLAGVRTVEFVARNISASPPATPIAVGWLNSAVW